MSPVNLVDGCLRLLGCYELEPETRQMLINHAEKSGDLPTGNREFARPGSPDAADDCGDQGVSLRLTGLSVGPTPWNRNLKREPRRRRR